MKKKRARGIFKTTLVITGAIILSTLALNATDHYSNLKDSLLGSVFESQPTSRCDGGMVLVPGEGGGFCIDIYEASASEECVYKNPTHQGETTANLNDVACKAASEREKLPWRNVARHQAELACAKAGKRLPSNKEWYRAALGTPEKNTAWTKADCNLGKVGAESPENTGIRQSCVSSAGVYDMIGNVWEWVAEDVSAGQYKGRAVPESGFVIEIDSEGVALRTDPEKEDMSFGQDYFWSISQDTRGMIRGGYWGNDSDAGSYAINTMIPPSFSGAAAGFRCVK